jgi:uncharacterized repeat protein (TIGR01451 family)
MFNTVTGVIPFARSNRELQSEADSETSNRSPILLLSLLLLLGGLFGAVQASAQSTELVSVAVDADDSANFGATLGDKLILVFSDTLDQTQSLGTSQADSTAVQFGSAQELLCIWSSVGCSIDGSKLIVEAAETFSQPRNLSSEVVTSVDNLVDANQDPVVVPAPVSITAEFSDDFSGATIDPLWEFFEYTGVVPLGVPDTATLDSGYLRIADPDAAYLGGYIPARLAEARVSALVNADGTGDSGLDNQIDHGVLSHFDPDTLSGYSAYIRYELNYQDLYLVKFDSDNLQTPLIEKTVRIATSTETSWDQGRRYEVQLDVVEAGGDRRLIARAYDEFGNIEGRIEVLDSASDVAGSGAPFDAGYPGVTGIQNSSGVNATFDDFAVESDFTPVDLSITTVEGLPSGMSEDPGYAYYTSTVNNAGGPVPENVVLWIDVAEIDDDTKVGPPELEIEYYDGTWRTLGWAGTSSFNYGDIGRDAWFIGRDGSGGMPGYDINAEIGVDVPLRINFPNGTYSFTTTVESTDSGDAGATQGDRVYLTDVATRVVETDPVALTLDITEGTDPLIEQPGFAHFTATLTNNGGDVPENVLLWTQVDGITNANVQDFTFQYFDGTTWIDYGWGGFGSGDFPEMDRQAYFIGRDGSSLVGIPIPSGYSESLPIRMDFPNGTYQVTTSVESFVDGEANNPGDRIYLNQSDSLVVESDPVALSLVTEEGLSETSLATEESGWAHYTSTLTNAGGDVPENVVLWVEVIGPDGLVDDVNVVDDNYDLQLWDGSQWQSFGWAGGSTWTEIRQAWFLGRSSTEITGFPIPAGYTDSLEVRANFPNGTYEFRTSVESLDSAEPGTTVGDRIYLDETDTRVIETDPVDLALEVADGVDPAIESAGFAHFTATLSNSGGAVPENVLLWTQIDGIDNSNVQSVTFQYFDGINWIDYGWGGFNGGDFPEMDREAYFIGRDGSSLVGIPIPAGYSESIPIRMDFDNGTYQVTTSVESFVDGDANNPGDRVYVSQSNSLVVESNPADLSITTVEGLPSGMSEDPGYAYYTSTVNNAGGPVPENVVLWIDVAEIDDDTKVGPPELEIEYYDGTWRTLGWAGTSSFNYGDIGRDAWFIGRDGSGGMPGYDINAEIGVDVPLRINFPNGTYSFTTTVESTDSGDAGATQGDRVYLTDVATRVVETDPADLSITTVEGLPSGMSEDPGYAYYTSTVNNAGGPVPENVVLWIDVAEIDDDTKVGPPELEIEYYDGTWRTLGWAGTSSFNYGDIGRDAWFIGRDGSGGMPGYDINAEIGVDVPLRINFPNGTYSFTTTVESTDSGDAGATQGDRVYLTDVATRVVETDPVALTLDITEGTDPLIEQPGFAHFTATLTNNGGDVPENVLLWTQVDGITNANVQDFTFQYFDGTTWIDYGWGGFGSGDFPEMDRQAYFIGRDGSSLVGIPIPSGYSESLPIRMDFPNGTYQVTTSVESFVDGEANNPGDRVYLNQSDSLLIQSDPADLDLQITEGLPGGLSETEGFAHYTATLINTGGAVPENVVLWIEVDGIDDADVADGATLEFYENGQWNSFGWAGPYSWNLGREAWFIGRDDDQVVGFEIPGNLTWPIPMRVNWDNGSYPLTVTVESTDGTAGPGEREYLNVTPTIQVEQYVAPQLSVTPVSHDFGEVGVLDAAATTFTLNNDGSSTTELTLGSIGFTGSDSNAYQVLGGSCVVGDSLAGGADCTVEVTFAPDMAADFSDAQLSVTTDNVNTATANLAGVGILPDWSDSFDGAFDEASWQFYTFDGATLGTPTTALITDDYLQINDASAVFAGGYIPRSFGESRVTSLVNADGTGDSGLDNQIDQGVISHFNPDLLKGYAAYVRYELNYQDLVLIKFDQNNLDPALIDERVRIAESSDGDWSMGHMYVVELDVVDQGSNALLVARAFDADTGALLATVETIDGDDAGEGAPHAPGYAGVTAIANSTGVNGTFDTASGVSSFASADLSDSSIDFGQQVAFSASAPEPITVTNRGNEDLNISALNIVGADPADFDIQNSDCSDPVAAGSSCSFEVAFTPGAAQLREAEVVIESNASTTPDAVLLEGEGTPAPATVTLSNLTQVYDSDPKPVTVTTNPAALNVIVTYDGGSVIPVVAGDYNVEAVIDEPDYTGSATGVLTIESADQSISFPAIANKAFDAPPFTISASASSGLQVSFAVVSGPANVSGNEVTLTGSLGTVVIEATQGGNANWNPADSVQQSFEVVEGDADSIEAVSPTSIDGQAGQSVAAGDLPMVLVTDSQDNPIEGVTVSFSVASGGGSITGATQTTDTSGLAQVGSWTLGSAATQTLEAAAPGLTGSPVTFTASVPLLEINPASNDYGDVGILDAATAGFTVTNTGSSSLDLTGVVTSGDSQFAMTGSGNCASGDTLNGGDSCTVEVTFDPDSVASFSGSLDITSDAGDVSAALSGAGILPDWSDSFDGAFGEAGWQFYAFDGSPTLYEPETAQIADDHLQINDPNALYAGGYLPRSFGESRVTALVNADGTGDSGLDNQIDQGVISHFDPEALEGYTAYIRYELEYQELVLAKFDADNLDPPVFSVSEQLADVGGDWSMGRMYVVELDVVDQGGSALLVARAFKADTGALLAQVETIDADPFGQGYAGLTAITNSTGLNGTFDTASGVSSFASADLSTNSIDFGQQEAFSTSAAQSVTVSNRGNVDLAISSLNVTGADAGDFSIQNSDCGDPVVAGSSCSFEMVFTPGAAQPREVEVVIESNASTSPDVVLLEGEGTPAPATVTLSGLTQVYDGDPKPVTVTTDPADLNVVVTYGGSATVPVNAGSYAVEAAVDEPDYSGAASEILQIQAADQTIDFPAIADRSVDDSPFIISATADSGLTVSFSVVSGPASVSGNEVTLDGTPGQVTIAANQPGDSNWNPAPTVQQSFQVTEGNAANIEAASATTINGQAGQPVVTGDLPTVLVTDSADNPVAGIAVAFSVASGGGSVSGASQVTDGDGLAQVGGWTLGPEDTQTLTASAPGLAGSPVEFTAEVDPVVELNIEIDDGRPDIEPGERNTYTITVSNGGPNDAEDVTVEVMLPAALEATTADWSCFPGAGASCGASSGTGSLLDTGADIGAGASLIYVLEVDVDESASGTIEVEAVVQAGDVSASAMVATQVVRTEDEIFSDRFEEATSSTDVDGTSMVRGEIEVSSQFEASLPTTTLVGGRDGGENEVFRIRTLGAGDLDLIRLEVLNRQGSWTRGEWIRMNAASQPSLMFEFDAELGSLILVGSRGEGTVQSDDGAEPAQALFTDVPAQITIRTDD